MAMREILTEHSGPQGSGLRTVMFFNEETPISEQRLRLQTFWTALNTLRSNLYSWRVQDTGRILDDVTGALVGAWTDNTPVGSTCTGTDRPLADASQVLIRWQTRQIVGRRFLVGRTFVPGFTSAATFNGNVSQSTQGTVDAAAEALIASGAGLGVWHRPKGGTNGQMRFVQAASVWPELAVLRRRRH